MVLKLAHRRDDETGDTMAHGPGCT
jgi:hypothetical protein